MLLRRARSSCLVAQALLTFATSSLACASAAPMVRVGPLSCVADAIGPMPSAKPTTHARALPARNAISYLLADGALRSRFDLSARIALPRVPANRGLFYSNWLLLIPFGGRAFVQIELMRWSAFEDRNEVGLTWALPDGRLVYHDTALFPGDGPHRLSLGVRDASLRLGIDGRTICTAPEDAFFTPRDRLYYQIGTEVSTPGDRPSGWVDRIELQTDDDAAPRPYTIRCVYRGLGVEWNAASGGRYIASGVFDPTQPYLRFTGVDPGTKCAY